MHNQFYLLPLLFLLLSQPTLGRNYVLHPQGQTDRTAEVMTIIDRM